MDFSLHRPPTPDSPLTNRDSLYDATATIDDLTQALENVSRVGSPEPAAALCCCCGLDDCENLQAWLAVKARLESRLTLSAEVGQALLQRHEAYVRRHEAHCSGPPDLSLEEESETKEAALAAKQDQLDELTKENKALEKRLTQALVNNEVTEVSNKTILQELAEAKTTISRLTTSAARSVGWDTRLSAAMKEKEDTQQERDFESQRARLAESRFAALKERTSKLQSDVRRLQAALEEQREHRLESSETILADARARIEALHRSVGAPLSEQPELTGVLETLVDDNETLKRDNAELQALLADAREDCRALQEEVEDQRVNPPMSRSGASTPSYLRQHFHTASVPSAMLGPSYNTDRRSSRRYEPLTPETNRRPLSPTDSVANSETRWTSFSQQQQVRQPSPGVESGPEDAYQDGGETTLDSKRQHKSLFLLARSRGVQTDPPRPPTPTPATNPTPYPPSKSPSSAASIYSDHLAPNNGTAAAGATGSYQQGAVTLGVLIERTTALLQRMQAADALSLTNRLKRAQIRGADVNHLSRTTVSGILADVGRLLRAGAGAQQGVDGEGMQQTQTQTQTPTQRRELRSLAGVLREMFGSMGEMRVVLNEVVLDPGSAGRISEAAMDPGRLHAGDVAGGAAAGAAGWMAPLSKLFAGAAPAGRGGATNTAEVDRGATASPLAAPRPMHPRFLPKSGPAVVASTTTVNVEFSGAGVGRAMTSTFDAGPSAAAAVGNDSGGGGGSGRPAPDVTGIFVGAPRTRTPDPWVVIPHPKLPRRVPTGLMRPGMAGGRQQRLSRNVDAMLDGVGMPARSNVEGGGDGHGGDGDHDDEADYVGPLLQRTLRRRGLSDSSIHSTFTTHGEDQEQPDSPMAPPQAASGLSRREAAWLESGSVFQALSRRVQSFRSGLSVPVSVPEKGDGASISGSEGGGGSGLGTSPPAGTAPIATVTSRRSSRASRNANAAESPLKTSGSASTGFGLLPALANLVPSGEPAELARSLRDHEHDATLLSRTYRPMGGDRQFM